MAIKKTVALAAVALFGAGGLSVGPAVAGEETFKTHVFYTSSDLKSVEAVAALHNRIERAAKRECNMGSGRRDLATRRQERVCVASAVENAVRSAAIPVLLAYHEGDQSKAEIAFARAKQ